MLSHNLLLTGDDGYNLTKSLRFRSSASAYLNRTPASATNRTTWTWSAWVKRGDVASNDNRLFGAGTSNSDRLLVAIENYISVVGTNSGSNVLILNTTPVYRDPSAWYHIVVAIDTTQATASNRAKIYVNGAQVTAFGTATYPAQNTTLQVNSANPHVIGTRGTYSVDSNFDGYMAELNFIDGQALTPSSFGSTNALTGVWQPAKYTGTYGTNGFYLPFTNTTSTSTLGNDFSGNSNTWTVNNISLTSGVTYDSFTDVPTLTSATTANYAVGNPLAVNVTTSSSATLTNGNLYLNNSSANYSGFPSTMSIPITGKWAWKFKVTDSISGSNEGYIGFACNSTGSPVTGASTGAATNWYTTVQVQALSNRGIVHKYAGGSVVTDVAGSPLSGVTGDEYEFLIDRDAGTTVIKLNGTTLTTVTGLPATQELFPYGTFYQTGGYFFFNYTPSDTSYKTLNTYNLPTSTIVKGNTVMDATTYTGTGASQSVVNTAGFKPDFVWLKARSNAYTHVLVDSIRGTDKVLSSPSTSAENSTNSGEDFTAFNSNGFSVGTPVSFNSTNANGATIVGWQWQAGQGSTSSNTSGSITSTVSVNATAGFSVVTYTGTGANATVGHGLGVAPSMMIFKDRSSGVYNWAVWHTSLGGGDYALQLNNTTASSNAYDYWNGSPSSTTFGIGTDLGTNKSGDNYVAYCWSEIAGFSKFGSYTGNGSTDGPFIYTGFRPKFVMIKQSSSAGNPWVMYDTSRSTYNVISNTLRANDSVAEDTVSGAGGYDLDILSNGFKVRVTWGGANSSGSTYIYMAFAENPFKNALAR